jgi:hypothetical protein
VSERPLQAWDEHIREFRSLQSWPGDLWWSLSDWFRWQEERMMRFGC